jgi:hypothetical protein
MFIFKSLKCPNLKVKKKILLPQCGSIGYPLPKCATPNSFNHLSNYNFHHCPRDSYVLEGHGVTMDMVSECYVNLF